MAERTVLLREIELRNLLSFGPDTPPVPLGPLNVLIGPNGSGKSNLIESICLLRASAVDRPDIQDVLRRGGGVQEWIWKGEAEAKASIVAILANPHGKLPLSHRLELMVEDQAFRLGYEDIYYALGPVSPPSSLYQSSGLVVTVKGRSHNLNRGGVKPDTSILAQLRDPEQYPEITYLAEQYRGIRVYREWSFGRNTVFREPQRADMRTDRLEEDFSNLGLFLNRLRRNPAAKNAILESLHDIYEGVDDFDVSIEGGTVQVFFTEGDFTIPATRLSDGTLRYLCLLAILCDPNPPPLVCIEEPELGLHPDILPKVADLLVKASERTQLIVTTHSDILVDALTERPEAVLVCEKHEGRTQIERLDPSTLAVWLDKYRLGELWTKGQLGGTRW